MQRHPEKKHHEEDPFLPSTLSTQTLSSEALIYKHHLTAKFMAGTKPLQGNHQNPPHQGIFSPMQSRCSMNTNWNHQRLMLFSKLDTHFPSSPARRASASCPCPWNMPQTPMVCKGQSSPVPSESSFHNHSANLPPTDVRRHPGKNRKHCFAFAKIFSLPFAHLLALKCAFIPRSVLHSLGQ